MIQVEKVRVRHVKCGGDNTKYKPYPNIDSLLNKTIKPKKRVSHNYLSVSNTRLSFNGETGLNLYLYMMDKEDIRWIQRLSSFTRALSQLEQAVYLAKERQLTDLEQQGLIQAFEFTHELAWNVMRDYFNYQGQNYTTGSRDATRAAFNTGLIEDGEAWMSMIKSRNKTSHTYNEETANEIASEIVHSYLPLFKMFQTKMESLKLGESGSLFNE